MTHGMLPELIYSATLLLMGFCAMVSFLVGLVWLAFKIGGKRNGSK